MAKKMDMGMHMKAHGWTMAVLGLLVLGNANWPVVSWPVFVGGLAVLVGLWKVLMPHEHCCC